MKTDFEKLVYLLLCVSLLTQFPLLGEAERPPLAKESTEAFWRDRVLNLPNCSFKYTIDIYGKVQKNEFSKFDDCFRLSSLGDDGTVEDSISFDGSIYYHLFSNGLQLTVSSENPEAEFTFAQQFKTNPLYFSLALLSEGNFRVFGEKFYPANLIESAKVSKLDLPLSTIRSAPMFEGGEALLECISSHGPATKKVYFDPLNPSRIVGATWEVQPKLFERWVINDSIILKQHIRGGQFFLPIEIIRYFAFGEYSVAYNGDELPKMKIAVDKSSVISLKGDLDRELFRIPRTAARLLRDVDKGTVVDSNEEFSREIAE